MLPGRPNKRSSFWGYRGAMRHDRRKDRRRRPFYSNILNLRGRNQLFSEELPEDDYNYNLRQGLPSTSRDDPSPTQSESNIFERLGSPEREFDNTTEAVELRAAVGSAISRETEDDLISMLQNSSLHEDTEDYGNKKIREYFYSISKHDLSVEDLDAPGPSGTQNIINYDEDDDEDESTSYFSSFEGSPDRGNFCNADIKYADEQYESFEFEEVDVLPGSIPEEQRISRRRKRSETSNEADSEVEKIFKKQRKIRSPKKRSRDK